MEKIGGLEEFCATPCIPLREAEAQSLDGQMGESINLSDQDVVVIREMEEQTLGTLLTAKRRGQPSKADKDHRKRQKIADEEEKELEKRKAIYEQVKSLLLEKDQTGEPCWSVIKACEHFSFPRSTFQYWQKMEVQSQTTPHGNGLIFSLEEEGQFQRLSVISHSLKTH